MDKQRQDDQLVPTYNSSVPIRNVALKTYRKRWMIEKSSRRGSGRPMLMARHDDDIYIYIYIGYFASKSLFTEILLQNIFSLWSSCVDVQVFLFLFIRCDPDGGENVPYLPKHFQPCLWSFSGNYSFWSYIYIYIYMLWYLPYGL